MVKKPLFYSWIPLVYSQALQCCLGESMKSSVSYWNHKVVFIPAAEDELVQDKCQKNVVQYLIPILAH